MANSTVFKIERGLPQYQLNDPYAALGLPLTADPAQVRSRYLSIVKQLHPDVFGRTPEQKSLATNCLSRLVNPAYQLLNNERERNEYLATLRLFGKSQQSKKETPVVSGETAQRLLKMPHEYTYLQFVDQLAKEQFANLEIEVLKRISEDLSELNLVFLFTQTNLTFIGSVSFGAPAAPPPPTPAPAPTAPPKPKTSPAFRNIQMAEILLGEKKWSDALKELQSAAKLDPENAKIYGMMGYSYMNMNNNSQAKTFFQKALKLDAKEENATRHLSKVEAALKSATRPPEKKGGLFGWGKK